MIQVKPIQSKQQWEEFEKKYAPNTFLQSWEWGESQAALGHKIYRLGVFRDDKLKGVAFFYLIKAKRGTHLCCPHGPLIDWLDQEAFSTLIDYLKRVSKKEKVAFIRIASLQDDSPQNRGLFLRAGFRGAPIHLIHPELAWMVDVTKSEDEILAQMKKRTRYSIRKATRDGVEIQKTTDTKYLEEFFKVYRETVKRHNFVPWSKNYIKREFEIFSKDDKILLFLARYKEEVLASAMVVYTNGSGFYHHGASTSKFKNIPASELLQWEAIKEAKKREMNRYNFWGIAPEGAPSKHPLIGVSRFKKGFGGFSESYLHVQDLPLNKKYWFNYVIERARRIKRGY